MESPLGWSPGGPGSVCLAFDQLRDVIESQEELIHQLKNVSLSHPRCPAHQSIIQPLSSSLEGTPPIPAPKSSLSQALLQMILQDENFVSKEEFKAMEKKLAEERAAHAKTKLLLAKEEEKLQFALGEVEVLSKQLEKEKVAFEKALSNVKSRVLQESSKKDQLITKCNAGVGLKLATILLPQPRECWDYSTKDRMQPCIEIESHITKQEDILNGKENEIKELQQVISQQKQIFRNHMSDFRIQKQQESYMAQVLDQKHKKVSGMRQPRNPSASGKK